MKVVRLTVLRTCRLYPPANYPGTHCYRLSQPQGHSAAGRIMAMQNSNNNIGNQTRDLPVCTAVLQPTALPCAPNISVWIILKWKLQRNKMYVVSIQRAEDTVQLRSIAKTVMLLCHYLSLCATTGFVRTTLYAL
jgi:hypothetical protein